MIGYRKAPLKKPNRGEGWSPESPGRRMHMIFLVYCIASLLYYVFVYCVVSCPYVIYYPILLWRDIAYLC